MKALVWNGKDYDEAEIPEGYYPAFTDNMDEPCTCPGCGKDYRFGELYTSHKFYRPPTGAFGFYVCLDCYTREREELR